MEALHESHRRESEAHRRECEAHRRECEALREALSSERSANERILLAHESSTDDRAALHQVVQEKLQGQVDALQGLLSVRCILERIAHDLDHSKPVTNALAGAFESTSSKFREYLILVADSKSVKLSDLVKAGREVYPDLSSRIHYGEGSKSEEEQEAVYLESVPHIKVLALGALLKFHKRVLRVLREKLPTPSTSPKGSTLHSPATVTPPNKAGGGGDRSGGGGSGGGGRSLTLSPR